MNNRKCIYLTEGECEEKLIKALKEKPSLLIPGKVKKFNVIQEELKPSQLMMFEAGSMVILVFDTDKEETVHLKKNIELIKKKCEKVEVATIVQVLNFEDEIRNSTDVDYARELTKSQSNNGFKSDVNRMKPIEFRRALKRHKLDISKLWVKNPPKAFGFVRQDSEIIKL